MTKKKLISEIIFLLIVFVGTIYAIFRGQDLKQSIRMMREVQAFYLIAAVICVVCFIWGESVILHYMMKTLDFRLKKWDCFLFSSIGFFFSCITPSATGGQPAQIYYMRRRKIPIPVATLVLLVVTITYKAVLVLIGIGIVVFGQGLIQRYLTGILPFFYLGVVLNVCCVVCLLILVFHTSLAEALMSKGLALMERLPMIHEKKSRHEKLHSGMEKYHETAAYLKKHKYVLGKVLAITFAQRCALFLSTYFVYRSFGLHKDSVATIILLQAVISISVDMLPLPGGMGISEKLFLSIFLPIFGAQLIFPGMILSRGLSYYTELLLSAFFTVVAHFIFLKKGCNMKRIHGVVSHMAAE